MKLLIIGCVCTTIGIMIVVRYIVTNIESKIEKLEDKIEELSEKLGL